MERRDFLKTSFVAMFALYGFSNNTLCFAGDKLYRSVTGRHNFTGVHCGTLQNCRVSLPDVFSRRLLRERLVLVVPGKNTSVLIFPESSPDWKALKKMFDEADHECLPILLEHVQVDLKGNLYLPENVIHYAGIRTPAVAITGRGCAIEITDSKCQA